MSLDEDDASSDENAGPNDTVEEVSVPAGNSDDEVNNSAVVESRERSDDMQVRWRKRAPPKIQTEYTGEPFPALPEEEFSPFQYFKMFFDDEFD